MPDHNAKRFLLLLRVEQRFNEISQHRSLAAEDLDSFMNLQVHLLLRFFVEAADCVEADGFAHHHFLDARKIFRFQAKFFDHLSRILAVLLTRQELDQFQPQLGHLRDKLLGGVDTLDLDELAHEGLDVEVVMQLEVNDHCGDVSVLLVVDHLLSGGEKFCLVDE